MNKIQYFENELSLIKNQRILMFAEGAICNIPDYFFEAPASSSGKHHPQFALGKGGLLRHTKAAVIISQELMKLDKYKLTDDEKDLVVAAIILHDSRKSGDTCGKEVLASGAQGETYMSKTLPEHPILAVQAILANKENCKLLTKAELEILTGGILSHMGQWNKNFATGEEILPVPKTAIQELIHMSDFFASRKTVEVNFSAFDYNKQVEQPKVSVKADLSQGK